MRRTILFIKMRNIVLFIVVLAFGLPAKAQEQNICDLLDSAYCVYKDNENMCFASKWTFLNSKSYSITTHLKTIEPTIKRRKIAKRKKGYHIKRGRSGYQKGQLIIYKPSILLSKDTIIIRTNYLLAAITGKCLYQGTSKLAMFVYTDGSWTYITSWEPRLEYRRRETLDDFMDVCYQKAVERITELSGGKKPKVLRVGEYWPYYTKQLNNYIIPAGANLKRFRRKADYFVGWPQATLNHNVITISLKIIKSNQLTKIDNMNVFETVSIKIDFSDKFLE